MGSETFRAVRRKLNIAQKSSISAGPRSAHRESERTRMSSSQRLILLYQEEEVSQAALKVFFRATSVTFSLKARAPLGVQGFRTLC